MKKIYSTSFSTPIGRIYLSATKKGLCKVFLGPKRIARESCSRDKSSLWKGKSVIEEPRHTWRGFSSARNKFFYIARLDPPLKGRDYGEHPVQDDEHFSDIKNDILTYLSGAPVSFKKYALDAGGTRFQKKVWRILSGIPYGKVLTYKQVAEKIGAPHAFRPVGNACGANKLPILIPCHRVIASNSGLGGFSAGLKIKRHLLKLEGIRPGCKHANK